MIGIATLEGYDVAARVSLFYKAIGILLFSFLAFNGIAYVIFKKHAAAFSSSEAKIINATSVAGIILFLFKVFDYTIYESIEIIYFLHKLMLAGILLKLLVYKKNTVTVYQYAFIVSMAVSLYFFCIDCFNLSGALKNPDFYIVTFIAACGALIALHLFLKNKTGLASNDASNKLLYVLLPLGFLPLISILKDEIFLILKANQLILNSTLYVFIALVIGLLLVMRVRHKKSQRMQVKSEKELISRYYFPLLIFSLISYTFYNAFAEFSDESFEAGNVYLPIMEFKLFDVIPTLEKFNSHMLSDYFCASIYTLFNGMAGREIVLYDFLLAPVIYILYYYIILYVARNAFVALFSVMLFPFAPFLFPSGFCYGAFGIFALNQLITPEQSLKKYLVLIAAMVGLVCWRIDMGYTCVIIMPLIILFYHVANPAFKINWKLLLKATCIVLGVIVACFLLLSLYRHKNIFLKTLYALNYFSSAQTYGYTILGWANMPAYKMHYFIFPVIVACILIALLLKFKALNKSKHQRLAYLTLLFLCTFYIINFNRGLIRHSLIEGTDTFTSTYVYIIIPATAFVFLWNRGRIKNYIVFSLLAFFLIINYRVRVPDAVESKTLFETLVEKTKSTKNTNLDTITNRLTNNPVNGTEKDKAFVEFIKASTTPEQTFIDFTNNPMLFYYTKKVTPSYFYQNPSCTHNEFLQNKFINDLQEYDAPYLLYAVMNDKGYNEVDDVPNSLRHYRMAEFFYNNYAPYIIAGNYCIWKRNNVRAVNNIDTIYSYSQPQGLTAPDTIKTRLNVKPGKKYLVRMLTTKKRDLDPQITHASRQPVSYVCDTIAYSIIESWQQPFELSISNNGNTIHSLSVLECDYIPDFYSEKFLSYDFKKLPYIWGKYDAAVKNEPVLITYKSNLLPENKNAIRFDLPGSIDRSSGNTVLITCKNTSTKTQRLCFYFGNKTASANTSVTMDILPSTSSQIYAVRISSLYKWHTKQVTTIGLVPAENSGLQIEKIQLTKAN